MDVLRVRCVRSATASKNAVCAPGKQCLALRDASPLHTGGGERGARGPSRCHCCILLLLQQKDCAPMRFVGSQRCDCCHPAIICRRGSSTKQLSGWGSNSANKKQCPTKPLRSSIMQKPLRSGCAASAALSDLLTYLVLLSTGRVPVYAVVAEFIGVFLFQFIGGGADANSISTGTPPASLMMWLQGCHDA